MVQTLMRSERIDLDKVEVKALRPDLQNLFFDC